MVQDRIDQPLGDDDVNEGRGEERHTHPAARGGALEQIVIAE
jgi:hypothetical protein